MIASNVAVMGALCWSFPALQSTLQEHLEENEGEVLPHVLMGNILLRLENEPDSFVRDVFAWLETAFIQGDDYVKNLIAVSAVEMIAPPGEHGDHLRALLAPRLLPLDPHGPHHDPHAF